MIGAPLQGLGAGYARRLMVDADVWRPTATITDAGGSQVDWVDLGRAVAVQLTAPSATERDVAAQEGVELTHVAVMPTGVDVARGDRLVMPDGTVVELTSDPTAPTHAAVSRATVKTEPFDEPL